MCIKLEKGTDKKITSFQNVVQTVNRVQMFRGVDGIEIFAMSRELLTQRIATV